MKKYELNDSHFWKHKQTGKAIISFEAIEKMVDYHDIKFDVPEKNYSNETNEVALLINGSMFVQDEHDGDFNTRTAWSFGEANPKNCYIDYRWAMAEKRGKGRVVMKLLGFYGGNSGFYADVEMEIQGEVAKNVDFGI